MSREIQDEDEAIIGQWVNQPAGNVVFIRARSRLISYLSDCEVNASVMLSSWDGNGGPSQPSVLATQSFIEEN